MTVKRAFIIVFVLGALFGFRAYKLSQAPEPGFAPA
jgi:hypothetical protein